MSWWTYVTRTSGTESPKEMSGKTGIDGPNFSKWKSGQIPGPHLVATFARAYGRPVLEAFVAAEFLTAKEAKERPVAAPSLSSLSEVELLEEVLERLKRGGGIGGDTAATTGPGSGPGNVIDIRGPHDDDLDALPDEADDPPPIRGRSTGQAARKKGKP